MDAITREESFLKHYMDQLIKEQQKTNKLLTQLLKELKGGESDASDGTTTTEFSDNSSNTRRKRNVGHTGD